MEIINRYKKTTEMKLINNTLAFVTLCFAFSLSICAQQNTKLVSAQNNAGSFCLSANGKTAPLFIHSTDYKGVIRALGDLKSDLGMVTGTQPKLYIDTVPSSEIVVIAGTIGKSAVIDKLISDQKIEVKDIAGKWETFLIQTVDNPLPGVKQGLVIAGSDKRGTIYGIYELSSQIGVSPWYWWADVPVQQKSTLYVQPIRYTLGTPSVKYRGIFINDEAPAFSGWTYEKFGGVNHLVYTKVFELLLRMKANYLWPAMWGNAFNDDDKLNPQLADEYGIVMGTSHHEPMLRSQQEWKRYGKGEWNYEHNADNLKDFWKQGIRNMGTHESILTMGMRGDGDMPMTEGSNIALLEKIVKDQRDIIKDVTGKEASEYPQLWALYKEVQDYYDKGMRVPDDITLLLCDDNWGNIRKLPPTSEKNRKGGYGIYYHFDYVGGPRSYKWLNTNQISRVWEQMHLAYEHGVDRIWIVNVGDIKPMEFPIQFFLDYAWAPDKIQAKDLPEYTRQWASQQFENQHTDSIADILAQYTRFNSRRKPELLSPTTYSLTNYLEAERVTNEYNALCQKAERIGMDLDKNMQDAYFQLVLHPVKACSNLNNLYVATAKNRLYAKQGRAAANLMADSVKSLYTKDSLISAYYNHTLANGKWNHMMDQTHIGYTYWQQPPVNRMPKVEYIQLPDKAEMGVAIEGSSNWWPNAQEKAILPVINNNQQNSSYIEIFNRGQKPIAFTIKSKAKWLEFLEAKGTIDKETRIWIKANWNKVPAGVQQVPFIVKGSDGSSVTVYVSVENIKLPQALDNKTFVESNGCISIEAEHYTKAITNDVIQWVTIPAFGRTLSGVTPMPVTSSSYEPVGSNPKLEYNVYMTSNGDVSVNAYFSPTLNFGSTSGLRYAVSIDDEIPQIINIHTNTSEKFWNKIVSENITIATSKHKDVTAGRHTLKIWMVDPGLVLQKIVVNAGGEKPSYLGPPESFVFRK
jgi:hypothetical protein